MTMINPVEGHVISTPDGYKRYCSKQNAYIPVPVQTVLGKKIQCTGYRGKAKATIESIIESRSVSEEVEEES